MEVKSRLTRFEKRRVRARERESPLPMMRKSWFLRRLRSLHKLSFPAGTLNLESTWVRCDSWCRGWRHRLRLSATACMSCRVGAEPRYLCIADPAPEDAPMPPTVQPWPKGANLAMSLPVHPVDRQSSRSSARARWLTGAGKQNRVPAAPIWRVHRQPQSLKDRRIRIRTDPGRRTAPTDMRLLECLLAAFRPYSHHQRRPRDPTAHIAADQERKGRPPFSFPPRRPGRTAIAVPARQPLGRSSPV